MVDGRKRCIAWLIPTQSTYLSLQNFYFSISKTFITFAPLKLIKTKKMATRIRLQRHGKKGYAFFHIVVADSRAPRDGKFIEKLGYYNPNTDPATIEINFDRALYWLNVGAQPTETVRRILSYKGVLYKKHLLRGVQKGALTEEQAEKKFQEWLNAKLAKIEAKKQKLAKEAEEQKSARLKHEAEIRQKRESKKTAASANETTENSPSAE